MMPYLSLIALVLMQDPLADGRRALTDFDLSTAEVAGAKALAKSPNSAEVHTFLGALRLRQGQIAEAEKEIKAAIQIDEKEASAWFELGRLFDIASMHHRAEIYLLKADELSPNNSVIGRALTRMRWAREHPDDARLTSEYVHTVMPLRLLMHDAKRLRGFALPVSINGGKTLTLLLDTGASGITLRTRAATGLTKISDTKIGGIGDKGLRDAWFGKAEKVQIGSVGFGDYPVEVTDNKTFPDDEDGLIGTDVFQDFMVTLDFFNRKLILDPLPGGKPSRSRTFDREITPELKGFWPIYRINHVLLIPTKINDAGPVLFMIDSGASTSLLANKVARVATKVRTDYDTKLKGLSGNVDKVSRADEVTIQFASFKQKNQEIITFNLDDISRGYGIELGGVLGLPLLALFRTVTIDYRDGMVKFEYKDR
jgi:predicted aspartyl protease